MLRYLLDTNIIIGMYEHNPAVFELFKNSRVALDECAYSSITRMELLGYTGISEHEASVISSLLDRMKPISIDRFIEDKAIILKQQNKMKLPDTIILATALVNKLELLTLDKKLANKFLMK